ncbi:hypothetical protein Tco_1215887 [Tanacetum coccineum]
MPFGLTMPARFWIDGIGVCACRAHKFLGHVINGNGIHVDPSKIEYVMNWKALRTPTEGEEQELAFQTMKDKLCNAHVLVLLDGPEDFVRCGYSCLVIMTDGNLLPSGKANVVVIALSRKDRD